VTVLGTPKQDFQEKDNAFVHAAADISTRGIASIHFDVRSITVKMCEQFLLDCNGPTNRYECERNDVVGWGSAKVEVGHGDESCPADSRGKIASML
jgi:hypothetical protein